jgi:thioredoxin 1
LCQCPCSGGPGINPLVLLAIVAGIWLLATWVKSVFRKEGISFMNKAAKILIVAALVVVVALVIAIKYTKPSADANQPPNQVTAVTSGLPRLVDIGAGTCIPCKMMAPILEELKKEYAGKLIVEFIDVREDADAVGRYKIMLIPTQIFFDAAGTELFRHEGFMAKEDILAKWKERGVDLSGSAGTLPTFERLVPAKVDNRPKDSICYMCDGNIDPKTMVTVQTDKGQVRLCSPHCYFIMYSCLTEDKTGFEKKVSVTDWATGKMLALTEAVFLSGVDEKSGRPVLRAFSDRQSALQERQVSGGDIMEWQLLQDKELATRCGFCDRAVYPQDGAVVRVGGVNTWGCCSHCAMGVAARTGLDIEVHERDRLTGQEIVIKTLGGKVASLEPATAVAWFGQRQKPDGTWVSAGCFHQGFFTSADNLKKWVEQNPYETGRLISISQALADKMKLSPEQIQKACKIGECSPK